MTEQSQMPLVGPPKRRGWREIVWFRPLTPSTHTALVMTRRGRLVSILPAGDPRALSDYLAWPYDFREVDTRERLLVLDQRVESFDSSYEFSVALRLIYQVVQPDRVALDLEDVSTELAHAVVQSLRLSGRSFGVEQDKTFEEHLQETLISGDALIQRVQLLGLVLRRADITVALDEATRAHAEALRFAMRERPLHFQIAVESLEPDRSFDVIVGGSYRLTERRAPDGSSNTVDSAIQLAITRTLRRVGITFAPSDYADAAKAMAEVLRKDALLQSELSMVQAQLLRPTVQIQPDRSMVHVPRPNMLGVPDTRPDPLLRRTRQSLPRMGRPPALTDTQARAPQQVHAPAVRRALPPPELADIAARLALPPEPSPAEIAASQTLPLGDLPAPGDPIEGTYTLWPLPESLPSLRAQPMLGQPDDAQDAHAPWADLISGAEDLPSAPVWSAPPPAAVSEPTEPQPWDSLAMDAAQPLPEEQAPAWLAASPASASEAGESQPWDSLAMDAAQPLLEEPLPAWSAPLPAMESDQSEPQVWASSAMDTVEPPATASEPVEPQLWASSAMDTVEPPLVEAQASPWAAPLPAIEGDQSEPQPWDRSATDAADQPDFGAALATEEAESGLNAVSEPDIAAPAPALLDSDLPVDLSFLLDWIEPVGEQVSDSAAGAPAPMDSTPADNLSFSLDWSEPEVAAPMAELPASALVPTDSQPADDLGFTLDWSEPQADPYAGVWEPNANTTPDDSIITAHWDDPNVNSTPDDSIITAHWDDSTIAAPEPVRFSDLPTVADAAADNTTVDRDSAPVFDLDPAQFDREQARLADLPVMAEPGAEYDEVPAAIEQESSPWYVPTLQLDDHLPFDSAADNSGYPPFETQEAEPPVAPNMPDDDLAADTAMVPLPETTETQAAAWAEPPVAPNMPDDDLAADAFQLPNEALDQEPTTTIEPASDLVPVAASELVAARVAPVAEISTEQIARIIGMIQSYGPAWFKMWSLELKERPERLPVVLGEVTADPVLLAQAADPRIQSALLAALAAYTPPTAFPARLPALASLPSPAITGQSNADEDEVPDWLSLRVKWNGHGGGA